MIVTRCGVGWVWGPLDRQAAATVASWQACTSMKTVHASMRANPPTCCLASLEERRVCVVLDPRQRSNRPHHIHALHSQAAIVPQAVVAQYSAEGQALWPNLISCLSTHHPSVIKLQLLPAKPRPLTCTTRPTTRCVSSSSGWAAVVMLQEVPFGISPKVSAGT